MEQMSFNPFLAYASLADVGYPLGAVISSRLGRFRLVEASADIAAYKEVISTERLSVTTSIVTVTDTTHITFDPEATVAAESLVGCPVLITNAASGAQFSIIKSNGAGASGSQMSVELSIAVTLTDGSSSSITVGDPCYMVVKPASKVTLVPSGITLVAVDQSEAPYFWMCIGSEFIPVLIGDTTAAEGIVGTGDNTEGQVVAIGASTIDSKVQVGTVVLAAPAADTLCVIRMLPR